MGNYRFRLSDLIPNSWFYKLKDIHKTRKNQLNKHPTTSLSSPSPLTVSAAPPKNHQPDHRKSYHFTRDLSLTSTSPVKPRISDKSSHYPPPEQPRRSSKRRSRRRLSTKRNRPLQRSLASPFSGDDNVNQTSSTDCDSISPECGSDTFDGALSCSTYDTVSEHDRLPPIVTKKLQEPIDDFSEKNMKYGSLSVKVMKQDFSSGKRIVTSPVKSTGVRLRANSPRIGTRRIPGRKSGSGPGPGVTESFAVVKSSRDPRRDFRESMVEMICENNIRESRDLEELLACYLSLNADEYHDLIVNVFKQIWFEFLHVPRK